MPTRNEAPQTLTLSQKLFLLQQQIQVTRDKDVAYNTKKGPMDYSYTTLEEWWNRVQKFFEVHQIRVSWTTEVLNENTVILVVKLVDVTSNEYEVSKFPLHMAPGDFRSNGALFSYWCRMLVIRACGLITNDDQAAEEFDSEPIPTTRKAKASKPALSEDDIVY